MTMNELLMTEVSDIQCCDQWKWIIYWVTSVVIININSNILFNCVPLHKIPLSQQRILLVLPHSHFFYHEKSFWGYSQKNLQFQEESAKESTRGNLQPLQASCSSQLQVAQSKLAIKTPTLRQMFPKLCAKEHLIWLWVVWKAGLRIHQKGMKK